jgi:hypothetical protein
MLITILMYSGCTGLSALSQAFWDFALYRFIPASAWAVSSPWAWRWWPR